MIVGGTDGVFHALKVNTGEQIWSIEVSKRAILNSPLFRDNIVYITHGEENIDTTEMGMIAAIDATRTGVLTADAFKWGTRGFLPTFASPVMDDERLYTMDNSAIVGAFDLKTGAKLWKKTLGTLQKGSPVLADGKLYVGTENGKFYILRPIGDRRRGARRGSARHRAQSPEADRRLADRRRRPRLRDVDGRDVCDREARAAQGAGATPRAPVRSRVAPRRAGARAGVSARSRC